MVIMTNAAAIHNLAITGFHIAEDDFKAIEYLKMFICICLNSPCSQASLAVVIHS